MWPKIWAELHHISTAPVVCLLLSCCLGLRYWKRLPRPLQTLVIYLIFNFLIEIGARLAGFIYKQNLPLLHLYTVGECLLFSWFYRQILDNNSIFKRYFNWILGAVMVLVILNTLLLQGIFEFNSYAKTLVQVLIILYALDYAFRFSEQEGPDPVLSKSLRLINAATLIYYCGSLFIFMSGQFEVQMGEAIRILWKINTVLNLVFQIMIFIALWKVIFSRPKLSSSPAPVS